MNELFWTNQRIEILKTRKSRCVCKYCGGELSIKRILFSDIEDARIELYCEKCDRIEFGIEPEIYSCACNFVDNFDFDFFEDMDDNEKKYQMNVAKISEIMVWGFKNLGLLDKNGFKVPIEMHHTDWQECIVLESSQIGGAPFKIDEG
ncbi:MAG: hypothetical protein U0N74_00540 [Peptococcaceae bacterium]|nr:hypothetical protein [Peptococcaceae bacterium]